MELELNPLTHVLGTLTNILVKKFLGKKFIPRFAKYLIKFPYYKELPDQSKFASSTTAISSRYDFIAACHYLKLLAPWLGLVLDGCCFYSFSCSTF